MEQELIAQVAGAFLALAGMAGGSVPITNKLKNWLGLSGLPAVYLSLAVSALFAVLVATAAGRLSLDVLQDPNGQLVAIGYVIGLAQLFYAKGWTPGQKVPAPYGAAGADVQ